MIMGIIRELEEQDRRKEQGIQAIRDSNRPFCAIYDDILEDGVFTVLRLDKAEYFDAFRQIRDYWEQKLPDHGFDYVLCSARQLGKILRSPHDWIEVGHFLADATAKTYTNGSHQFIEDAVPALIDSGICKNKEDLKTGVAIILNANQYEHGELSFVDFAERMKSGVVRTLDDLANMPISFPKRKDYAVN